MSWFKTIIKKGGEHVLRLKCEFKCDKIPVGYQMLFVSIIKQALKDSDKEYYKKIYTYNGNKANKQSKNFCFSVFMKDFEKNNDDFLIKDKVSLIVSSNDCEFILKLYNGLLKNKEFQYKSQEYILIRMHMDLVREKEIKSSVVVFKTLSPLFIKNSEGNALEITDTNFIDELNYISDLILKNSRGYGLKERLKFSNVLMSKKVVKEEIRNFTQNTGKKFYYLNAYSGIFKLEGDVEDLKDIYMLGIGFKRNQGMGMIEVI